MGFFTRYCALCGMKIGKNQDVVKLGMHFDSEQHAEIYAKQYEATHSELPS